MPRKKATTPRKRVSKKTTGSSTSSAKTTPKTDSNVDTNPESEAVIPASDASSTPPETSSNPNAEPETTPKTSKRRSKRTVAKRTKTTTKAVASTVQSDIQPEAMSDDVASDGVDSVDIHAAIEAASEATPSRDSDDKMDAEQALPLALELDQHPKSDKSSEREKDADPVETSAPELTTNVDSIPHADTIIELEVIKHSSDEGAIATDGPKTLDATAVETGTEPKQEQKPDSEISQTVEVVVDQPDAQPWSNTAVQEVFPDAEPDSDTPQPIHPMEAMTAQLNQPLDAIVVEAIEVDSDTPESALPDPMVEELNTAMAQRHSPENSTTAHEHEAEPEVQIKAIQNHEDQLNRQVIQAEQEAERLTQELTEANIREAAFNQEIAELKAALGQAKTQVMQSQSQLNDQDKNQREIDKLKGEVTTLKEELDEAKRYILKLTDQLTEAQTSQRSSLGSQTPMQSSSTTFPPPLPQRTAPHTRVVPSPRSQPRQPVPRPPVIAASDAKRPAGLPPMSTERFGATERFGQTKAPEPAPSSRLRKAYTRPGFSNPSDQPNRQRVASAIGSAQPMPPLESITRSPSSSGPSPDAQTSQAPNGGAIVPQQRSPIARRRSRYDELKPELKSSDIPQPKVSDSEIGWFD